MNVLIVPEDFRKDQYILRPLFQRLFRNLGRPAARVRVCQNPLLGGIHQALNVERLSEIVDQYRGMTDLFILCVDCDGRAGRRHQLDGIEQQFADSAVFFAENAWEELETWVLAGVQLPSDWSWSEVRAEVQVKEVYFDRFVRRRGLEDHPGGGRKPLGEEAARRMDAIRAKCLEDFDALAQRISDWLSE